MPRLQLLCAFICAIFSLTSTYCTADTTLDAKKLKAEMEARAATEVTADALAIEMWSKYLKDCPAECLADDLEVLLKATITLNKQDRHPADVAGEGGKQRIVSRPNKAYNLQLYDALVKLTRTSESGPRTPIVPADLHGKTALMYAAEEDQLDVVAEIVHLEQPGKWKYRYGRDYVDRCDNLSQTTYGYSALMYAASKGHADVVGYLLNAGADPTKKCKFGEFSAIQLAKMAGHDKVANVLEWKEQKDTSLSPFWNNLSTILTIATSIGGGTLLGWLWARYREQKRAAIKAESDDRLANLNLNDSPKA